MAIKQIEEQEERVSTGAIQFGDDWPGLFIRGDSCFGILLALKALFKRHPEIKDDPFISSQLLENLIKMIEEDVDCNFNKAPE